MPRPALSIEQHKLKGTRPTRAKPDVPSEVSAGRPRMPKFLSEAAQIVWRETVRLMRRRGTLSSDCASVLAIFCTVSVSWQKAVADVEARGQILREQRFSKSGDEYFVDVTNPSVKIQSDSERQLLALQKSLGFAPDSRAKVKKVKEKPENIPAVPGTAAYKYPQFFKSGQNGN